MRLILDTNIFLAAMGNHGDFSRSLLLGIFDGSNGHQIFISPAILEELYEKSKEMIAKKLIDREHFQKWIKMIYRKSEGVSPKERVYAIKQDSDDNKILECAIAAKAHLIISMDQHLLRLKTFRNIGIVHPKTFFYILAKK